MPDVLKLIQERLSARGSYDPKRPVSKQDLEQILAAFLSGRCLFDAGSGLRSYAASNYGQDR